MIITDALARRLEYAEAVDAAACVEAACKLDRECDACSKAVAGGVLTFCGPESPLTHAIGVGMHGPVTLEEILEIEAYFESRGAPVTIDVCPHADPSVREILSERCYRIVEFSNVLLRALPAADLPSAAADMVVRPASAEQADLYASTITRGFFGREVITDAEYRLGRTLFAMPCSTCFLAYEGEKAVAAGSISIRNGVASFFGDATLAGQRGRGVHTALIAHRLRVASQAGCDVAVAGTQPGSTSQRNYQRSGFTVAYSKITLVRHNPL